MKGPHKSPLRIQQGGGDFFDLGNVQYILNNYVYPNLKEQARLLPDSILYGSLILALVTQSYSTAIFAAALVESGLIGIGIKRLLTYMDLIHTAPDQTINLAMCDSSYYSPTIEYLLNFGYTSIQSAFPSFPVYFLTTACSYIVTSLFFQKKELEAMGPSYSARFYISIFASFLLLLSLSAYRLANSCENVGVILVTILTGLIIGSLISYQMNQVLGPNAINLTGVPLLRERTRDGKPLYVCPQQVS